MARLSYIRRQGGEGTFVAQTFLKFRDVATVAGFHNALYGYDIDVSAFKSPLVRNVHDARAFRCDDGGELRQTTGTITDAGGKSPEPPVRGQAAF